MPPQIVTDRLTLVPLSLRQVYLYLDENFSLEKELGALNYPRKVPKELLDPINLVILPSLENPDRKNIYYTLWVMICRKSNQIVGDLCFKGPPNKFGEMELGYGTYPDFQKKGYMTNAITGLVEHIAKDREVKSVIAETNKDNLASIKTLKKANFIQFRETEKTVWWKIKTR